jgi:hypothetical protein
MGRGNRVVGYQGDSGLLFWRGFAPEMPTLMVGVGHGAHLLQGDGKFAFPSGSVLGIL